MSWDIDLVDKNTREVLHMPEKHHFRGANYVLGGTTECSMNITYNYSPLYRKAFPDNGINIINGKTGEESVPLIAKMIGSLGDDRDDDYWKATEGNAKQPLFALLVFAAQHPEGVWEVD